jgi:hypothetical protein
MRVKYVTRPLAPRASAKWGFRRAGRQRRCDLRRGMVAGVAGRLLRRLQPRVADGRGACHSSGLSVRAFCKNVQVVQLRPRGPRRGGRPLAAFAEVEHLPGHGDAVRVRTYAPEGMLCGTWRISFIEIKISFTETQNLTPAVTYLLDK